MVNIKKYNNYINENVIVSDSMSGVISYLANVKKDKAAIFLKNMVENESKDFYKDSEILNFIGLAKEDNMVTYLPTNKRALHGYWENFEDTQRVGIRIGRAVKKIYDTVSKYLTFKKSINVGIFRESSRLLIDIPSESDIGLMMMYGDDRKAYKISVSIKGEFNNQEFEIQGNCRDINNYWVGFKTMVIDPNDPINVPFPMVKNVYDTTGRRTNVFDIPIQIEATNEFSLSDADVEKFVNEYISYVKGNKSDDSSVIDVVNGEEIRKWYFKENYQSSMGKLGGSCMAHSNCSKYLDIYVKNPDSVSMLILKNKEEKLVGRSLLWNLDNGEKFMDRVYTANDYDDNIFYNYAIANGYLYRSTPADKFKYFKDSKEVADHEIAVTVNKNDFDYYPYMDTLFFLGTGVLYNKNKNIDGKTLKETEGRWSEWYDENDDDDDD